jgi:hypothetical protein
MVLVEIPAGVYGIVVVLLYDPRLLRLLLLLLPRDALVLALLFRRLFLVVISKLFSILIK